MEADDMESGLSCGQNTKWDNVNMEKAKKSTKTCQNVEVLQRQNLILLEDVEILRTKVRALAAREFNLQLEQSKWREREQFLEKKLAAYETNAVNPPTVERFQTSTTETETQTEVSSQTDEENERGEKQIKPHTKDIQLQTDLAMHSIEDLEYEVEHCVQKETALHEECNRLRLNAYLLRGKLKKNEKNEVRLETERREMERRAMEAETQLKQAQDDMVQMEKAFQKECAKVQSSVEAMNDAVAQKGLCEADTHSDWSLYKFEEMEKQLEQEDGADEELVSELRLQLQQEAMLKEEREKAWMAQQAGWKDKKAALMNRVNELFEDKTKILAMYMNEKEKRAELEKNAKETSQKSAQMTRAFRAELWRRDVEKMKADRRYDQQLEHWRQREDEALVWILELTKANKQLESELNEAREKEEERCLREVQWKEAKERLLHQTEVFRATNKTNKRKKSKGFFSKLFGSRN